MFISFDGVDGVGKTTQIELLSDWLRAHGHEVIVCRDPGSTSLGEEIRTILLDRDERNRIDLRSEMLLYMAARAQLVDEVIAPALARGKIAVVDRFLLANVVYQGHAGGLDVEELWRVGEVATAGLQPDLVFLLDMLPMEASQRIRRERDRMEQRDDDYRLRLREGFLDEARRRPQQIVVVDAACPIAEIHTNVCQAMEPWLTSQT